MSKGSSYSPGGGKPGRGSNPRKGGEGQAGNDARPFKKNYDGRGPGPAGGKKARPYSGRATGDSPKPGDERRPYGAERKSDAPRKPFREFNKSRSADTDARPGRSFDGPPPSRDDSKRDNAGGNDKHKEFDKPRRGPGKPFSDRAGRSSEKPAFRDRKPGASDEKGGYAGTDRPRKPADSRPFRDREKPVFGKEGKSKTRPAGADFNKKPAAPVRPFKEVVKNVFNEPVPKSKDVTDEGHPGKRQEFEDKVYGELEDVKEAVKKPYEKKQRKDTGKPRFVHDHSEGRKKKFPVAEEEDEEEDDVAGPVKDEMPLNKFIAHSGECSRRDAAELVKQGKVKVNGELVIDPGYKIKAGDSVTLSGKKLTPTKGLVYLLLNKPKGYITTNDDPQGRRTVMELVSNSGADRLFPVGRLDRDTTGLLLITNDGELTQRLCHPSFNIKKVYHVSLDKPLTKADFDKIMEGVELEDGKAAVDEMAYLESKNELGLEIHSGKNRIVRRIFESLGYVVEKLDRMMYAGLTKKNLPRGKYRKLTEHEVVLLKHFKQP